MSLSSFQLGTYLFYGLHHCFVLLSLGAVESLHDQLLLYLVLLATGWVRRSVTIYSVIAMPLCRPQGLIHDRSRPHSRQVSDRKSIKTARRPHLQKSVFRSSWWLFQTSVRQHISLFVFVFLHRRDRRALVIRDCVAFSVETFQVCHSIVLRGKALEIKSVG